MIKNFDKIKSQLSELAEVLNKFHSEAVQLKLIDILYSPQAFEPEAAPDKAATPAPPPVVKRRGPGRPPKVKKVDVPEIIIEAVEPKAKKEKTEAPKAKTRKKRESLKKTMDRPGPTPLVKQLIQDEYFNVKRTIGNIVSYCQETLKLDYRSTDLSGTLAKLTKDGLLVRNKNPETNQFEYIKA